MVRHGCPTSLRHSKDLLVRVGMGVCAQRIITSSATLLILTWCSPLLAQSPKQPVANTPAKQTLSAELAVTTDASKRATAFEPISSDGDNDGTKLPVSGPSEDQISIRFADQSIYRQSGKAFGLRVQANASSKLRGKKALLQYSLFRVADGELVDEQDRAVAVDANGDSDEIQFQGIAPERCGVYEIRCQLVDAAAAIWSRLKRGERPAVEARFQMIVFQPLVEEVPTSDRSASRWTWTSLGDIRPAQHPGWELRPWLAGHLGATSSSKNRKPGNGLSQAQHAGEVVSLLEPKSTYSTRLPTLQLGVAHRLTIRYPVGQTLHLRVDLAETERFDKSKTYEINDATKPGSGSKWASQSLLVFPTAHDKFVRLTNLNKEGDVAFESISLDAKSEKSGLAPVAQTRPNVHTALLNLSDQKWMDRFVDRRELQTLTGMNPESVNVHKAFVATERLRTYLLLNGYNAVIIPGNRPEKSLQSVPGVQSADSGSEVLEIALRQMNGYALGVYVGCVLAGTEGQPDQVRSNGYQLIDPEQFSKNRTWLSALDQQAVQQRSYLGIVIDLRPPEEATFRSESRLLSESVLRRFVNESDSINSDRPSPNAELSQLRAWATDANNAAFRQWCDAQSSQALVRLASELRGQCMLMGGPKHAALNHPSLILAKEIEDLVGIDSLASTHDGGPQEGIQQRDHHRIAAIIDPKGLPSKLKSSPNFHRFATRDLAKSITLFDPQYVVVNESESTMLLDESFARVLRAFTDLPLNGWSRIDGVDPENQTIQVRTTKANSQSLLVIANLAPWKSDVVIQLAESLPWQTTSSQSGFDGDVPVDIQLRQEGSQLTFSLRPGSFVVLSAPNSNSIDAIRSWNSRVSGGQDSLTQIKQSVTEVVERIGRLSHPKASLGIRNGGFEQASPFKQAGPFKQSDPVAQPSQLTIPGWMHTQHPADSVRIDATEAIEGRQSIVLKTQSANAGRTWMVSEQFAPPRSGRLAVSLSYRGELIPGDQTKQRLQISIEGTRSGEPIRFSQTIEIARDGQWQPRHIVLEAEDITSKKVDSIRLTIDSLSRGRVWIDDIQLHDWFPLAQERRQLQDQAFMAVQGLQRGRLDAASSLLQNNWAQSLLTSRTTDVNRFQNASEIVRDRAFADASKSVRQTRTGAPKIGAAGSSKDASRMPRLRRAAKTIKPPSVAERIKGWLPRPLRF